MAALQTRKTFWSLKEIFLNVSERRTPNQTDLYKIHFHFKVFFFFLSIYKTSREVYKWNVLNFQIYKKLTPKSVCASSIHFAEKILFNKNMIFSNLRIIRFVFFIFFFFLSKYINTHRHFLNQKNKKKTHCVWYKEIFEHFLSILLHNVHGKI